MALHPSSDTGEGLNGCIRTYRSMAFSSPFPHLPKKKKCKSLVWTSKTKLPYSLVGVFGKLLVKLMKSKAFIIQTKKDKRDPIINSKLSLKLSEHKIEDRDRM